MLPTQLPSHRECSDGPSVLVAVTVKRYHTPFVSPVTVAVTEASSTTMPHRTLQCTESVTVASQLHAAFASHEDAVVYASQVAMSPTSPQLESIAGVV